jgi:hypothetical protein
MIMNGRVVAYSYIPMSKIATYSGRSSLLLGMHDVMPLLRICCNAAREDKHKTYQNATNDVVKGMTWCFREKVTTRTSNPINIKFHIQILKKKFVVSIT